MTDTDLKAGDNLYRVYCGTFGDTLEVVTVVAVRPQTVRIKGAGSAFGWRATMTIEEASKCPRTREAAVEVALERAQVAISQAEQRLSRLRAFAKEQKFVAEDGR